MSTTPLATLDHVTLTLGARAVLRDVSTQFVPGMVVALVGPNGAGKTSLLKILAGLLAPSAGTVTIEGRPITQMSPTEIAATLAYLPQSRHIHWPMSVRAIVALGRLPHQMRGTTTADRDADSIAGAMAALAITAFADRPALTLSGGEQARVLMARALAQEPKLLIADEPTDGLDIAHQLTAMQVLRARAAQGGTTIVALHDLGLAARFADRIILLSDGQMVAAGVPAEVLTAPRIAAIYGVDMLVTAAEGVPVFVPRDPQRGPIDVK